MKCGRCGETCKENQAFCLRCGTPIQVVPDFNLIEAELASNIGELMDEEKSSRYDSEDIDFLEDESLYVDNIGNTKDSTLEFVDIKNYKKTVNDSSFEVDGFAFNSETEKRTPKKKNEPNRAEIQKEKKLMKVKAVIISMFAAIIIGIVVFILAILGNKTSDKSSFDKTYKKGYDYYSAKNYDEALSSFRDAKKLTDKNSDILKVDKYILACYQQMSNKDAEMIDILKELIELSPSSVEYYEQLIELYDANNMNEDIDKLIDGITDSEVRTALSEYTVFKPNMSFESGTYNEAISIKLSADAKTTIYYTLDGTEPNKESTAYTSEIKLNYNGDYVIKAIAYNEKGTASKIAENTYTIDISEIQVPEITPSDSEEYDTAQKITINVPAGMKCYYTYGPEASIPTAESTEYTEPVDMLRGKNTFSAIFIGEDGTTSEVTQMFYSLNRVYDYDGAMKLLRNYFISTVGAYTVSDTQMAKGATVYDVEYDSIEFIDNCEYWIFRVVERENVETDSTGQQTPGTVKNITYYGIDTVSGLKEGKPVILVQNPENADKYILTE